MKKVLHTYNLIMDSSINPLRNVKNLQVRHMVMQLLACMWSLIFGMYIVESIYAFGISALAHALLITMTVLTAIYFRQVQKAKVNGILTRGKGGEHE